MRRLHGVGAQLFQDDGGHFAPARNMTFIVKWSDIKKRRTAPALLYCCRECFRFTRGRMRRA